MADLPPGLLAVSAPGGLGHLPHVGGEGDHVVILVDVVHDRHLEESLGSVVHDLVRELGLGNVLSQLLDAVASSLGGSVFVNDLVALVLGLLAALELADEVHDHGELTPEERILGRVHCVLVHLQQVQVDAGDSLDGTLMCTRPGKSAFRPSMVSERVFRSLTSTSFSSLLMVRYFSLPPFSLARPSTTFWNSSSSALTESLVTFPSSAYSPILLAGLAQMGSPLTYTLGSCLRFNQMMGLSLG